MYIARILFVSLFTLLTLTGCPKEASDPSSRGQPQVVGGTAEPDYKYPWVVTVSGTRQCHGVLIHPKWVLTAAHCVATEASSVSVRRTDPYRGTVTEVSRKALGPGPMSGVHLHPNFNPSLPENNDIALVKLAEPFHIIPHIQTVGLPPTQRVAGVVGTVAVHTERLPPDKVAIFRAGIPQADYGPKIQIFTTSITGSLCPGDSGSGFVTREKGRAIVRGIVSTANATSDCVTSAGNLVEFIDVYNSRNWIFQTIGMTDYFLAGNTRARWAGRHGARGVVAIGCNNPYGAMWGPLDVAGVEEGANCEFDKNQHVLCSMNDQPGPPLAVQITGFTMKTFIPDGSTSVRSLPFLPGWATYFGELPYGYHREFTCTMGSVNVTDTEDGVFTQ